MHGLVSLLDQEHSDQIEILWAMLETRCELTGIKVTPFPHFSWLIADDFAWPELEGALQGLAEKLSPFRVRTTGIGIFSSERPVIFIPVVRTTVLDSLHAQIWEIFQPHASGISDYYSSDRWVPHISLAYSDVTTQNIGCVMKALARQDFDWEIEINNISLIHEPAGTVGTLRYHFSLAEHT